ncbi:MULTISPECIES: patatin-like phospholipase family protein [unclassified Bosea (in: a-proteobacteria)]|uniref:patatin-like phospholipase family protein n=1 Tax=unclassified Bosea (in: a-proteobacteria) TaxID=2653178 RepID=UPI000F7E316D|nr:MULTISPECIES: patatin-like phospholipase family protein [unclassified Bosea (in: a-proteobacteria)]RXT16133.1 hypothetical protein B5U98_29445 [Bosea sp. Tri-39]RXT39825.1 hypothetical protein B5U99_06490 [Bosea sp. Tri-54]
MQSFKILSIDGGGIRGILPAVWLSKIEKLLGGALYKHFDLIAGTSTGSAIAAVAASGRTVEEALPLYREQGPEIFPVGTLGLRRFRWLRYLSLDGPSYVSAPLSDALKSLLGAGHKLKEAETQLLIPAYDVFTRQPIIMKSHSGDYRDIPTWEACTASCSAPTYFPAHVMDIKGIDHPMVDGGVFANNPVMLAMAEALRRDSGDGIRDFHKHTRFKVLSLGTGNLIRRITTNESKFWNPAQWVRPMLDVIMDGSAESAHYTAQRILRHNNYIRWQITLNGVSDDLDDASEKNIDGLFTLADSYITGADGEARLEQVKRLLLDDEN